MIAIAWTALFTWPVVAYVLFRKLSLPVALCTTILGGYLLLPSDLSLDLPLLPPLGKHNITTLAAFGLTVLTIWRGNYDVPVLKGWLPRDIVVLGLLVMLGIGAFGTALTNGDVLIYGPRVLSSLAIYDSFSILLEYGMSLLPLFLGRRILASVEGQRVLVLVIVISALTYSIPTLWEVRMSPQLHSEIYGYFPHSFAQHMRQGGFRPIVFLDHGLSLGLYFTFAFIGVAGLLRAGIWNMRGIWVLALGWLFILLVLCKSLGALLIGIVLVPVALLLRPRTQLMAAACIAGVVMTYPILRAAQLVPVDRVMAFAESISEERALSFNTRIVNEEILLKKASERPFFGWGGWGRQRVFDELGNDISITDGSWVVEIGGGGWFRYIPIFGLLCWPIVGLFFSKRGRIDPICATIVLLLSAKLVDLIPNSGMIPIVWLMAGSLIGRLEMKLATTDVLKPKEGSHIYRRDLAGLGKLPQADVSGRDEPTPEGLKAPIVTGSSTQSERENFSITRQRGPVRYRR